MDSGAKSTLESFNSEGEADSVFGGASSMAGNLEQKRKALRGEVSLLKKRLREIRTYLKTQGTCTSRNAEIESKIQFVKDDIDALSARKSELETEIAALTAWLEAACRDVKNESEREQHEVDVEDQNQQAIAFYEKILQFRHENEIFDEEFPPLQVLEDRLNRCAEFVDEVKSLRERFNTVIEMEPEKEHQERKRALRSYTDLMLQYHEAQLKRTKLVLLRLQKAKKKINCPGVGNQA